MAFVSMLTRNTMFGDINLSCYMLYKQRIFKYRPVVKFLLEQGSVDLLKLIKKLINRLNPHTRKDITSVRIHRKYNNNITVLSLPLII